jgi:hypothetical protein
MSLSIRVGPDVVSFVLKGLEFGVVEGLKGIAPANAKGQWIWGVLRSHDALGRLYSLS